MQILEDDGDVKYPVTSKDVKCCLFIGESNWCQVPHILQKDTNKLTKEICMVANVDDNMIYNANVAHSRYAEKMSMERMNNNIRKRNVEENIAEDHNKIKP